MLDLESFQPRPELEPQVDNEDQLSTCFKSTLAYAGHSGRRLLRISRGVPRRKIMIRGASTTGVVFSSPGETPSTTLNLSQLSDSGGAVMRPCTRERWKKSKCCARKCRRCKSVCLKMFLVTVNFIFMVSGWALLTLGIWIQLNHNNHTLSFIFSSNPTNPTVVIERIPFALVGVGMLVTVTSFLGCCGACTENVCFLSFYAVFISLMVITEVVFGFTIGSLREGFSQQLTASMAYQLRNQYNKTAVLPNVTALEINQMTIAWDTLQSKMNCCGVLSPRDYMHTSWFNNSKDTEGVFVPRSCCIVSGSNTRHAGNQNDKVNYCQVEALIFKVNNNDSVAFLHTQGCQPMVMKMFEGHLSKSTFLLVCLICVQFVDLVLSCILMSWVKKKQSEYWWCEDDDCA